MALVRKQARRIPSPGTTNMRFLAEAIRNIFFLRLDAVGEVTLSSSSSTTAVTDIRVTKDSGIVFQPMTANAAAEIGNGTMYTLEANMGEGAFTITHANNAQTDRVFRYIVMG